VSDELTSYTDATLATSAAGQLRHHLQCEYGHQSGLCLWFCVPN